MSGNQQAKDNVFKTVTEFSADNSESKQRCSFFQSLFY